MNDVIRRLRRLRRGSLYLLTCASIAVGKIYAGPTLPKSFLTKVNPGRPFGRTLLKIRRRLLCLSRRRENYFSTGTFVIGSDDRLPLFDNSPFMLKAKGKYARGGKLCEVTANWTSPDLAHKILINLCDRFMIVVLIIKISD